MQKKKKKIGFQTIGSVMAINKQDCQYSIYQKLKKIFGKSNGFHLWKWQTQNQTFVLNQNWNVQTQLIPSPLQMKVGKVLVYTMDYSRKKQTGGARQRPFPRNFKVFLLLEIPGRELHP